MHKVLVNRLFKLAHEKVWLGELTVRHDLSLGRKATKQKQKPIALSVCNYEQVCFMEIIFYVKWIWFLIVQSVRVFR